MHPFPASRGWPHPLLLAINRRRRRGPGAGYGHIPQDWLEQDADWTPLSKFLKGVRLETGGGQGTLMVDAGAMLPGDSVPSGRRQEVEGAIKYIAQQAGKASN